MPKCSTWWHASELKQVRKYLNYANLTANDGELTKIDEIEMKK